MHTREDVEKILSWESRFLSQRVEDTPARQQPTSSEIIGYMVTLEDGRFLLLEADYDQRMIEQDYGCKPISLIEPRPEEVKNV